MTNETNMPEMTEEELQEDNDRAAAEDEFDRRKEEQMIEQLERNDALRESSIHAALATIENEALRLGQERVCIDPVLTRVRALLNI